MLETLGHTVHIAWDGSQAIEKLFDANGNPILSESDSGAWSPQREGSLRYDVIFMDCNMPVRPTLTRRDCR